MSTALAKRAIPEPRDPANRTTIAAMMSAINELSGSVGNAQQRAVRACELIEAGVLQLQPDGRLGAPPSAAAATITIPDVAGLQEALDGRSLTGHGHGIPDTAGLQAALDGKFNTIGGVITGTINTTSLIFINNDSYGGLAYAGVGSVNLYGVGGGIFFRPNGRISSVGAASINAAGDLALSGGLTAADISNAASSGTIVRRTSSGYIVCNYLNTTAGVTTAVPSNVWVETGSDSYHRKQTLAQFADHLIANTEVGQRKLGTLRATAVNTTLVVGDGGGGVVATATCTITCPSGIPSLEIVTIFNRSTGTVTLTGPLLRLAGTSLSGNRTIGPFGIATLINYGTAGEWWVSGPGVS